MKLEIIHSRPYQRLRDVLLRAHATNMWMAREDLARRHLRGDGIEIGAWTHPVRVPPGARRRHVDRADRATLIREDGPLLRTIFRDPESVVHVDVVDDAERLAAFADASLDFVIAAHVVEHLEDPVRALQRMAAVLRPGGVLMITLPDARHSFDAPRERTSVEHLRRDHREGPEVSRRDHYAEWAHVIEGRTGSDVDARVEQYARDDARHHFHVWELDGFLALLRALGLPLDLLEVRACVSEFTVVLRRCEDG